MKITEKQSLILFDVFKWTTTVHGDVNGYSLETRNKMVNQILNQQSDNIIDLKSE